MTIPEERARAVELLDRVHALMRRTDDPDRLLRLQVIHGHVMGMLLACVMGARMASERPAWWRKLGGIG